MFATNTTLRALRDCSEQAHASRSASLAYTGRRKLLTGRKRRTFQAKATMSASGSSEVTCAAFRTCEKERCITWALQGCCHLVDQPCHAGFRSLWASYMIMLLC